MNEQIKPLVTFLAILSFITGVMGGVGGIALVATSPTLQKSIGIKTDQNGSSIPLPSLGKVENITVKEDSAVVDAVKKDSPSVVSIVFTKDVEIVNPFSFDPFSAPEKSVQRQQGGGSGFVITSDGLIATNKHVASVEGAEYTVITQDGKKYKATILAKDPFNDFAILKIDAKNLPVMEYGDSDSLDVGQKVIAIGNALGEFQNTVTVGVLSGKERNLTASDQGGNGSEELEGLLQIDAAINQGNSGGPLVNLKGQIIGINTATASKTQAEGIGFAIPINSLKTAIDSVQKNGKIVRPYIGVRSALVDEKVAAIKGIEANKGALVMGDEANGVAAVSKGSPAESAGIKEGDVILKINNDQIGPGMSLRRLISKYRPGDEVTLRILRQGKEFDQKVKLGEMTPS